MNCKQGDRAIIIRGLFDDLGRLVRVIDPAPDAPPGAKYVVNGVKWIRTAEGHVWVCEALSGAFAPVKGKLYQVRPVHDRFLLPLPPESETLDEDVPVAEGAT